MKRLKKKLFKTHSIYLANQQFEPFGISTLEAISYNRLVLGKNEGGTPEIINHGLNGFLYPNKIIPSKNLLKNLLNKKYFTIYKTYELDWEYTTKQLLKFLKNQHNKYEE